MGGCVKRPAKRKERARAAMWPDLPVNVHMVVSACFTTGVYLNGCLHLLSSNVKEYICAWLEAQEESLKSSFFILSSQKSEGIVWENEGRKKMFYFPISPALSFPCLSAEAHLCLLWNIVRY